MIDIKDKKNTEAMETDFETERAMLEAGFEFEANKTRRSLSETMRIRLEKVIQEKSDIDFPNRSTINELGIRFQNFEDWLAGTQPPEAFEVYQIAQYYGVSMDYLFGTSDEMSR